MPSASSRLHRFAPIAVAVLLALSAALPAAAADPSPSAPASADPSPAPQASSSAEPAPTPTLTPPLEPQAEPTPDPSVSPSPSPTPLLAVSLGQQASTYDPATNKARIVATATSTGATAPWQYAFAVRGSVVASGESGASSVAVTVVNDCSITTQSLTVSITDAAGRTAGAAATLNRSLCPPPPNVPHAADRILAGPTLTEDSFVDRLRAVGSPALPEGRAIYRTLVGAGVNPAFALGTFQAESSSGTKGYAVITLNWGNILYHSWEDAYGAVPYAPGNGYTYAKYPSWLASVRAYAQLLTWYHEGGYTTVSSASAHWLGTREGSSRHLTYLGNITAVMSLLPDDAVPAMTSLAVPSTSRAGVSVAWTAKDNLGVTGYQVRWRPASGSWTTPQPWPTTARTITLADGTWKIAVRATDAAGNWSPWRSAWVIVDASAPVVSSLTPSQWVPRAPDRVFRVAWKASDNVGITRYQLRMRKGTNGAWSTAIKTTARSRALKLKAGSWTVAVRARDAVGNWSAWREIRVVVPRDDRAWSFSAGTARLSGAAYYRRTLTTTSRDGARMTVAFTGTTLYLVGPSGPAYGRMRVTIDGSSQVVDAGTYRGKAATKTRRRVVLLKVALPAGSHLAVITNLATRGRPTIGIDALGFGR